MSSCKIFIYHAGSDICFYFFLCKRMDTLAYCFSRVLRPLSPEIQSKVIYLASFARQWWTFENSHSEIDVHTHAHTPHTRSLSSENTSLFPTLSATSMAFYFSPCAASSIQDLSVFLVNSPITFCLWSVTISMQQNVLYSSVLLPRCFTVSCLTYHCWQKHLASCTHIMKALNVFWISIWNISLLIKRYPADLLLRLTV